MNPPTFSVVMPAFNTAATIGSSIQSVLAQTRPDFEVIVVDDGSTDDTAGVVDGLKADERIQLIRQDNQGAAAARNVALMAARGEYVAFLDSDDLWLPTYLEAMAATLAEGADAGFSYTDAWTLDPATGRIGTATAMAWQQPPAEPPPTAELLLLALLDRNFIYTAVTVRRTVFDRVGLFDESLRAAIDYDMWLRIAAHGYTAVRPRGLLAVYRRGRVGSISRNRANVYASLSRVYERVANELPVSEHARNAAQRRLITVSAELAALEGTPGLDRAWRVGVRPRVVRARNALLRRDRWRDVPPSEVAEAFPELFIGHTFG